MQPGESITPHTPHTPPDPPKPPQQPNQEEQLEEKTFSSDSGEKQGRLSSIVFFILSWIVTPLVIVLLFQAFVFQAFYVQGQSMEPTFQDGDYLVISKIGITSQKIRKTVNKEASLNYKRGDILVFRPPIALSTFYIKRLIGLPGDRVIVKDGKVSICNKENPSCFVLNEPYIEHSAMTTGDVDVTVDQNKVFVLGDNREPSGSYDSRQWGQLPETDITGRVLIRLLPVNRFKFVGHVPYVSLAQNPISDLFELPLIRKLNN